MSPSLPTMSGTATVPANAATAGLAAGGGALMQVLAGVLDPRRGGGRRHRTG